jgi:large subunit ribosomal protein L19
MLEVNKESHFRMQVKMAEFRPPLAPFAVGDAVELRYAAEHTEADPLTIRGTVIAKRNKGIDSKFTILNAFDDEWYEATYPYYTPLLRSARVMMKQRFSQGQMAPRKSKLYYLRERDPKTWFYVDSSTKEAAERQAEKAVFRALQKAGKTMKKAKKEDKDAKADGAKKGGAKK